MASASKSDAEIFADAVENLTELERWWMGKYEFLESRGYRLRPRFRPGWVPSFHLIESALDATRIADGRQVVLKSVARHGQEVKIAMMLSSPEALKDPMNHCVPILDYFGDPNTRGPFFIAMPVLRHVTLPDFQTVSEIVDFVKQTLEGIVYLHRNRVAHRDLTDANIMMDASKLFPDGVHPDPLWSYLLPDRYTRARLLTRTEVGGVKYYIIDFDISTHFEDPSAPRLVVGILRRDNSVPELDEIEPYDPFLVDVFTLGNTYKEFFDKYINFNALSPLVERMTRTRMDPGDRPTAEEALALFRELTDEMDDSFLNKRLTRTFEPIIIYYIRELSSSWNACAKLVRQMLPRRNATFVIVSAGLSAMLLLRGSRRIFVHITDFFGGVRNAGP